MPNFDFVLIHSPLLGNLTWQPTAAILQANNHTALTPKLIDKPDETRPYWKQEIDSLEVSINNPIIVGHSGAGALLPIIRQKLKAQAIIFVDAVVLFKSQTRLQLLEQEDKDFSQNFEAHLKSGGQFPEWTDEQLQTLIIDNKVRQNLISDQNPRSYDFFSERIPLPQNAYQIPIGYIQLSDSYTFYANQAQSRQWLVSKHISHHFMMLTEPDLMANLIMKMTAKLLK